MLTVKAIEAAIPKGKSYKLSDGKGLYLEVMPSGAKYWRLKYRVAGKEKRIAFGVYPEVRPREAREKTREARNQVREGTDPSAKKKADVPPVPTSTRTAPCANRASRCRG